MIDRVAGSVRRNPVLRYLLVGGVCLVAGGVAGAVSALVEGAGAINLAINAATSSVAMAAALAICAWWWRGLDEAAREAHKWAWYWGSNFGLAIGGVGLLTLMAAEGGSGGRLAGQDAVDLLMTGAFAVVGVQALGYAVAWAFWWLQRR